MASDSDGTYEVSQDLPPVTPMDRDYMIRTVMGEAGSDPASQPGVAAVIANRMRQSGQSAINTVLAKGQFEPWASRPNELMSYSPDSPAYQAAGKVVDGALSGNDPTGGATKFYAPAAQAALGRKPPAWDDGTGVDIGKHRFFGGSQGGGAPPSSTGFLTDFPLAGPGGSPAAATPATSPPASPPASASDIRFATPDEVSKMSGAAPSASQSFLTDFPLAKPGAAPDPAPPPSAAPPIGVNDAERAFATGIPIFGGTLNRADAAVDALLAPALNRFFSPENQLQGDTWGERYTNALAQQNTMDADFAKQHPTANNALQIGGAIAGTAAGMRQVPAAFGVTKAGLVPNVILGGTGGAIMGGADAAIRSDGDSNALARGAIVGGGLGLAGPIVGATAGSAVNALSNALARTTTAARTTANALNNIGMTPANARNALADIGPQATLADVDPALTGHARGLAQLGGEPTSVLRNAYAARAAGADSRAADLMDQRLGPKPDLNATLASLQEDAATRAGPLYQAGRAGPDMDITPVLASIDRQLPNASGGVASVLTRIKGFLTANQPSGSTLGMAVPKSDPEAVLGARQAIDDLLQKAPMDTSVGRNAVRAASDLRGQLDGIIKTNPNYATADAIYSQNMGIQDAMQRGTDVFKSNLRPEDMSRALQGMTPEEQQAYRSGARVAIGDAMEQGRRGELAAAQSMFGKGSANRAKLEMLFPHAQDVFDALHGEASMRATENAVRAGTATAENQAIRDLYAPRGAHPIEAAPAIIGEAIGGGPLAIGLTGLRYASNALSNAASEGARARLTGGMARGLSASGASRDAFLDQVARAHRSGAATNALAQLGSQGANLLTHVGGNALQQYLPAYHP